ncbi:site-2 protease family protein [Tumidithrix elongata RA019]|uniref:Zinc metalloprotease n=1 Tax=Tumidithrix elongata BACA0141 TaxID=2716417 RepID=A0AAW9PSA6_9CYAN|nr:site-2 protease family protein [Tumidithrix elongata RA019]
MKGGIRIGKIFGIPLHLDPSWFLIVGLMAFWFSAYYAKLSPNFSWAYGLLNALLLFLSVLLHELGHSLTAKAQGIEVTSITLYPFGGTSSFDREFKSPWILFSVSIAGPLVNLILGMLLISLAWTIGGDSIFITSPQAPNSLVAIIGSLRTIWGFMALNIAYINIILGVFNLIPGLPLDGGQVLKAAVWQITGDRTTGIRWAARSGQILGIVAMLQGVLLIASQRLFDGFFLMLLGWFVMNQALRHLQITNLQQALQELTAEEAMTRDFRIVDADMTLRRFADEFLLMEDKNADPVYFASSNGRDRGIILAEEIRHVDRSEWENKTLHSIVKPLPSIDSVELKTKIPSVINLLEEKKARYLPVLSQVGSVAGIVDRGDVIRALSRKFNWKIPEAYIQNIKKEGKFPPELPLADISAQIP